MPEEFFTDRLVMSRFKHEDAEEIFYTYASKPQATKFVSWPTHERIRDTRRYLEFVRLGWDAGIDYSYAIRLKHQRLIGSCGVVNDYGKLQFGYILSPTHWGNGYATEVCRRLMDILRAIPEVKSVGTFIDADNHASGHVLLKSGLVVVEKRVKWYSFVNQNNESKDCVLFKLPLPGKT